MLAELQPGVDVEAPSDRAGFLQAELIGLLESFE